MSVRAAMVVLLATALLSSAFLATAPNASAQTVPRPRYYVTILATGSAATPIFTGPDSQNPNLIVVPLVPAILNITVEAGGLTPHTFTIRSSDRTTRLVHLDLLSPGEVRSTEFTLVSATEISIAGGPNQTAEVVGGRMRFICLPHEGAGMQGFIVVGGLQTSTEPPEKGVFLRAYWIGLLGMAGTLLLVGLSYFVIKSGSPHFRDHHEHVRRGGP